MAHAMKIERQRGAWSVRKAYKTKAGMMVQGTIEDFLDSAWYEKFRGKVQLVFTSPPFALNKKKAYGNKLGLDYVRWFAALAPRLRGLLKKNGSIVVEMGNAWEPGRPVMSTVTLEALLEFMKAGNLVLCQQCVCYNPARLPSPAQWVNIERIRVKDSFTHVWWMAPSDRPKASNRRVLRSYSKSMIRLLKSKKYNSGKRPSEHSIGVKSFLKNNKGAIPPNVLSYPNTRTNDAYQQYCRKHNIQFHPARMQPELAEFFIQMLTNKNDLVMDPFGGTNTTGAAAQKLKRRWLSVEPNQEYVRGSRGRFPSRTRRKSRKFKRKKASK